MCLGSPPDALFQPLVTAFVEMQRGPGQVVGVVIQESADIAPGICGVHIVHGPSLATQFIGENLHAGSLMNEFLAMKIELAKEEPFFENPGGGGWSVGNRVIGGWPVGNQAFGGCPFGDQAFGFNKLVRQEQKIQARFCIHHLVGTIFAYGSLSSLQRP